VEIKRKSTHNQRIIKGEWGWGLEIAKESKQIKLRILKCKLRIYSRIRGRWRFESCAARECLNIHPADRWEPGLAGLKLKETKWLCLSNWLSNWGSGSTSMRKE
jgi:hypothetical protein